MKKIFNISRGDFFASLTLLLLIIATFTFYFLYDTKAVPVSDLSRFQKQVEQFYAYQRTAADSAAAARDSINQNRRHGWSSSYSRKQSAYYQNDTSPFTQTGRQPKYEIVRIDLNHCDTSDIMRVPTFGSKRAKKIVEYREKLGGFHSLSQLKEIYILQNVDLKLCEKYFVIHPLEIQRIRINEASYQELVSHPYFDAYLAKTILAYREKNGKIKDIYHFQQITHAYQELLDQLSPYLSFE